MSDLDARLTAALQADSPPERDPRFRIDALLRVERARFKRRFISTLAVALAASALVIVNAQALEAWIATDIWRISIVALGAVSAMFFVSGVPIEALPGFKGFARTLSRWLYP